MPIIKAFSLMFEQCLLGKDSCFAGANQSLRTPKNYAKIMRFTQYKLSLPNYLPKYKICYDKKAWT